MRICKFNNCKNTHKMCKGYCGRHYSQINNCGGLLKRTIRDPNEIIIKETHAEIVLYDLKHKEKSRTKIDLEDVELVKKYKWNDTRGYVGSINKGNYVRLSRLITNAKKGLVVDHINHNTLDNRKKNLRVVSQKENVRNNLAKGFNKVGNKYVAYLHKNGKNYSKSFATKEEAKEHRFSLVKEHFGKFYCEVKSSVSQ